MKIVTFAFAAFALASISAAQDFEVREEAPLTIVSDGLQPVGEQMILDNTQFRAFVYGLEHMDGDAMRMIFTAEPSRLEPLKSATKRADNGFGAVAPKGSEV